MNPRQRWRFLADCVFTKPNKPEFRTLASYDQRLSTALFHASEQSVKDDFGSEKLGAKWTKLSPKDLEHPDSAVTDDTCDPIGSLHIRTYIDLHNIRFHRKLELLSGFDNTGNVKLWFSELLLAHAMFYPKLYPALYRFLSTSSLSIRNVCELGAGMTGAAGLSTVSSAVFKPELVVLTDGNGACVDSLEAIVAWHNHLLQKANVKTRLKALKLLWPDQQTESPMHLPHDELFHNFQLILASDCFFNISSHKGLLAMVDALLGMETEALFLALAPRRGQALERFVQLAQSQLWSFLLLSPKEFIDSIVLQRLLSELDGCSPEFIYDSLLGHLIILKRRT